MHAAVYEVRVEGAIPRAELAEFVGMTATYGAGGTVLRGVIDDQPGLIGVVARVESVGCAVVSLERVGAAPESNQGGRG